jgi:hypothetical protein
MGATRFSKEYMVIGAVFLIYFFSSFFSMSYSVYSLPACLALGYAIAIDKKIHR